MANPVLTDYPDPRANVFLMTRFRTTPQHDAIAKAIRSVLTQYSLNLIRADLKQYEAELWRNVVCCLEASDLGIAVFEQIDERDINPNVSLELGYMLGRAKQCLLLKEKRVPTLPTDLIGHLYREFDSYRIARTVRPQIRSWLRDLGIARKRDEQMLVFVSQGGTCRCAMAKAITLEMLKKDPPLRKIRVESAAYGNTNLQTASVSARTVISKLYGRDLLANHRVMKLTPELKKQADLILVMSADMRKGLPEDKTFVLKPFLGLSGDVSNPWPDHQDAASAKKYERCALELEGLLKSGIGEILTHLSTDGSAA